MGAGPQGEARVAVPEVLGYRLDALARQVDDAGLVDVNRQAAAS
jgi:hypothetical protein